MVLGAVTILQVSHTRVTACVSGHVCLGPPCVTAGLYFISIPDHIRNCATTTLYLYTLASPCAVHHYILLQTATQSNWGACKGVTPIHSFLGLIGLIITRRSLFVFPSHHIT